VSFESAIDTCMAQVNRWEALGAHIPADAPLPDTLLEIFDNASGYLVQGHNDDIVQSYLEAGYRLDEMHFIDQADLIQNNNKY